MSLRHLEGASQLPYDTPRHNTDDDDEDDDLFVGFPAYKKTKCFCFSFGKRQCMYTVFSLHILQLWNFLSSVIFAFLYNNVAGGDLVFGQWDLIDYELCG